MAALLAHHSVKTAGRTVSAQVNGCSCCWGRRNLPQCNANLLGPTSEDCVGRCGTYVEGRGPVLILSGVGLDVQDDDHNEIYLMQVSRCQRLYRQCITVSCLSLCSEL